MYLLQYTKYIVSNRGLCAGRPPTGALVSHVVSQRNERQEKQRFYIDRNVR